jgi:hypothetical protein
VKAAVFDAQGHGGKRSQGIDRIEVAEMEDGLDVCRAGEIDLKVVAEFFPAMEMGTSAQQREPLSEMGTHAVGGGFVVAGRFDFNEFANGLEEFVLAGFEVLETVEVGLIFGVSVFLRCLH